MDPTPELPSARLLVIELPIPGVLTGQLPTQEPADPEMGWTTTDDEWE